MQSPVGSSENPWRVLEEQFHITKVEQGKAYRFQGEDLLKTECLQELLSIFSGQFVQEDSTIAISSVVQASMFSKQYGSMLVSGTLYAYYFFGKIIDVSLAHISLETEADWNPVICVDESYETDGQVHINELMTSIFARHLTPVFQALSAATGAKERLLWANLAFSLKWYYEQWIKQAESEEQRSLLKEDARFVMEQASAQLFGLTDQNPLNIEFEEVPHPRTGAPFRLRKSCCLRYSLPGCEHCTTCPNIEQQERLILLDAYEQR